MSGGASPELTAAGHMEGIALSLPAGDELMMPAPSSQDAAAAPPPSAEVDILAPAQCDEPPPQPDEAMPGAAEPAPEGPAAVDLLSPPPRDELEMPAPSSPGISAPPPPGNESGGLATVLQAAAGPEPMEPAAPAEPAVPPSAAAAEDGAVPGSQVGSQVGRHALRPSQGRRRRLARRIGASQEQRTPNPSKKAPSAYFMWLDENRKALAEELGSGKVDVMAKLAGERWRLLPAEDKASFEARAAEARTERAQALALLAAQRGPDGKVTRGGAPKKPWGGAYGVFVNEKREEIKATLAEDAPKGELPKAAGALWRELGEEERCRYHARHEQLMEEYHVALEAWRVSGGKIAVPLAPPGVVRSAAVTQGPAKGWKVQAWLNVRGSLQWKILEPRKSGRAFSTFSNFKALRKGADERIYAQLSQMVRPGLVRRLTGKVGGGAECETPPKARKPREPRMGPPAAKPRRSAQEAGLTQASQRPTQVVRASQAAAVPLERGPWHCSCEAHLLRHPRCAPGGRLQPALVHLGDGVTIGRGEKCDVVLDSARTPQMLSRCHAALRREGNAYVLSDQGSTNGILVNGSSAKGPQVLRDGDLVTFGVQTPNPEFDYVFQVKPGAGTVS